MRLEENVANLGVKRNTYTILVGKVKGKKPFEK
jgi:hypothetical protein